AFQPPSATAAGRDDPPASRQAPAPALRCGARWSHARPRAAPESVPLRARAAKDFRFSQSAMCENSHRMRSSSEFKTKRQPTTIKRTKPTGEAAHHAGYLLLDHAKRSQGDDLPGGERPALSHHSGEHLRGRTVFAGVPEGRTEQPHSGAARSCTAWRRSTTLALRIRRHPALSRREDRAVHPE